MRIRTAFFCTIFVLLLHVGFAIPAVTDFEDHVNADAIEIVDAVSHPITKAELIRQAKEIKKQEAE